ncbi:hypothetical protein C1645_815173 [Glomus cerebriforme]|uniref:Uncharacterized protein n=1 Tax=Glomus cerebriforme TaxID=658196 RepID=A0A397TFC5_9GLOM|nr:hypothetical protein C1645_815173 [Glomus cerebriforme]
MSILYSIQLNTFSTELRSKFISEWTSHIELKAEVKSLKSNIKTLKKKLTLVQKASSVDKVQILSFEAKVRELEGWLSDDLRPLVYERDLEDKVMELDKSFARENILEALQELLPWDEMFIPRKGVAKQLGGTEVVPLSQEMLLASVTVPVIMSPLMSPMLIYSILTLVLIAII